MTASWDAVVVPGGGVREDGSLWPWAAARFRLAVRRAGQAPILALSAGTVYRPHPRDADGFPLYEATAGARLLVSMGVPETQVLTETLSLDTVGNAYCARTLHAEPAGWRRLLVITSAFHMPRVEAVFHWAFALPPAPNPFSLAFEASADEGMDQGTRELRERKEAESLSAFLAWRDRITNLREFHRFLFAEHLAYRPAGRRAWPVSPAVRESY